jgi:hypothetical protein
VTAELTVPTEQDMRWAALAAPFPADQIELLPKPFKRDADRGQCDRPDRNGVSCGGWHGLPAIHLHYVGHAGVTMRLNQVDPTWTWEPMYRDVPPDLLQSAIATGNEEIVRQVIENAPICYTDGGLWIRLTVLGVTRPGFGDAQGKGGPNAVKEIIGDAIRNAGMRFGIGTYLWSKSESAIALTAREDGVDVDQGEPEQPRPPRQRAPRPPAPPTPAPEASRDRGVPDVAADVPVLEQPEQLGKQNLTPDQAARLIAVRAAGCTDVELLRNTYRKAGSELLKVDVLPALSTEQADYVNVPDGKPVPLGAWLIACAKHVEKTTTSIAQDIADAAAPLPDPDSQVQEA